MADARAAGLPGDDDVTSLRRRGATAYADAVATYLALIVGQLCRCVEHYRLLGRRTGQLRVANTFCSASPSDGVGFC